MSPEFTIEIVAEPDGGFRWLVVAPDDEAIASSPVGVLWPTEEECRTAAETACRACGFAVGLVDATDEDRDVRDEPAPDAEPAPGGSAFSPQADEPDADAIRGVDEPLAALLAVELVRRGVFSQDWCRLNRVDLTGIPGDDAG